MNTNGFVFWDTETTGLDKHFHVPVEIGGVISDGDLRPIRGFDLASRPPRFVLPDPGALVATGRSITELNARQLSCYAATTAFVAEVRAATPTCFVTYNGVSFDDPLIQHAFYRNLHDPYLMMKGGNRRLDILNVVRAMHSLGVGRLVIPTNSSGKPVFKLDQLAPLNGFNECGAHSASVDARALLHLTLLIREQSPEIWDHALKVWSRKDSVRDLLISNEFVIHFEWNWRRAKPAFKALMPIAPGRSYPGEFQCVDLSIDPSDYASLTPEELVHEITIGPKPRPICPVRLNAVPIVFPVNDPLVSGVLPEKVETLLSRARRLRTDPSLRERILVAADLRRAEFSEPEHPEQQLYSGGFITDADMEALKAFHDCDESTKAFAADRIRDRRLNYFATRLMYEEWPSALSASERSAIDAELNRRLHAGLDVPWTTYATAQQDIELMLPDADAKSRVILLEYLDYLKLASNVLEAAE
jgi:exodeoxyribonuclease-1